VEGTDAGDEDHAECGHAGQGRVPAPAGARGRRGTVERLGCVPVWPATSGTVTGGATAGTRGIVAGPASGTQGTFARNIPDHNSPSHTVGAPGGPATSGGGGKGQITRDAEDARPEWGRGAGTGRRAGEAPPEPAAGRALSPAGESGG
jgi:hypothetical protein